MNKNSNLIAVVCGMPFSGTTFLSRIISAHPQIDAGFECGMLFEESPRFFSNRKKFYSWMMSHEKPYNWKLTEEEMSYICDTDDFYIAYDRIIKKCHLFENGVNKIIDKTPAYIYRLRNIMNKVADTPFIVVKKETDFQFYSYKKRGREIEEFKGLYEKQIESINKVLDRPRLKKRMLVVQYEDLQKDLEKSIIKIFEFIQQFNNLPFNKDHMLESMLESIQSDIHSNQKKLRKKFNFENEKSVYRDSFDDRELEILNTLT